MRYAVLDEIERTKKLQRVPVVFTREDVACILAHLHGVPQLMASLLYGAGLRLMECVRLRVKDVEPGLKRHLKCVKLLYEADLLEGFLICDNAPIALHASDDLLGPRCPCFYTVLPSGTALDRLHPPQSDYEE